MAVTTGGNTGGSGGASVGAISTTRLDVVDPHLVQMMRDVMAGVDTAGRLGGGQGGAGGGGADSRSCEGRVSDGGGVEICPKTGTSQRRRRGRKPAPRSAREAEEADAPTWIFRTLIPRQHPKFLPARSSS